MTNRLALLLITTGICLVNYSPALAQTGKVVLRTRSAIMAVAYSPDGKILAAAHMDMTIRLWDTSSHKILATLQNDKNHVKSLAFSPDGKTLATGAGATVIFWNVSTGTPKVKFKGQIQYVTTLAFSPDGMTLATGTHDKQVRLWDVKTGKVKDTFPLHGNAITAKSLAFSPDGNTLAVGTVPERSWGPRKQGHAGGVQLWDLTTKKPKGVLFGDVSCIAFSPDGKTVALGSGAGARLYHALTGQPKGTGIGEPEKKDSGGHRIPKTKLAFSPNTKLLGTANEQVQLWDLSNGKKLWSFKNVDSPFSAVAISPDGKSLACGRYDGLLELRNYKNKKQIATLNDIKMEAVGNIYQMAVSPDGTAVAVYLAAGYVLPSKGGTHLVDVGTGEVKARIGYPAVGWGVRHPHAFPGFSMENGKIFIRIWDVQTGKQRWTLSTKMRTVAFTPIGNGPVSVGGGGQITVSGDLKLAAHGSSYGSIKIWDIASGKRIATFSHKISKASSGIKSSGPGQLTLAFSPDGKILASAGQVVNNAAGDTTIRLWDVRKQKEIAKLDGHTAGITALAFIQNGKTLASGSRDHTVRYWDVSAFVK